MYLLLQIKSLWVEDEKIIYPPIESSSTHKVFTPKSKFYISWYTSDTIYIDNYL